MKKSQLCQNDVGLDDDGGVVGKRPNGDGLVAGGLVGKRPNGDGLGAGDGLDAGGGGEPPETATTTIIMTTIRMATKPKRFPYLQYMLRSLAVVAFCWASTADCWACWVS